MGWCVCVCIFFEGGGGGHKLSFLPPIGGWGREKISGETGGRVGVVKILLTQMKMYPSTVGQ